MSDGLGGLGRWRWCACWCGEAAVDEDGDGLVDTTARTPQVVLVVSLLDLIVVVLVAQMVIVRLLGYRSAFQRVHTTQLAEHLWCSVNVLLFDTTGVQFCGFEIEQQFALGN